MSIKLPPLPKPDINTASHIGQRIVGYTEKTVERLCREAIEADRAERQGEAVALIQLSDLNELMNANGMSVWMENPLIHPPHCEGDAPVGFVSVYLAPAPKPAPATQQSGVGNSGFDHNTAADFLNGRTVSDEAMRKFVAASRWAHDDRVGLQATLLSVRNELAAREAEIALLKTELMDAEAVSPATSGRTQGGLTNKLTGARMGVRVEGTVMQRTSGENDGA